MEHQFNGLDPVAVLIIPHAILVAFHGRLCVIRNVIEIQETDPPVAIPAQKIINVGKPNPNKLP